METSALGVNSNLDLGAIRGRGLEGVFTRVIAARRKFVSAGIREFEGLAVRADEGVGEGVEGERSCEGHGSNDVGGGDKGMCGRVSVISSGEVTVVRGDD